MKHYNHQHGQARVETAPKQLRAPSNNHNRVVGDGNYADDEK